MPLPPHVLLGTGRTRRGPLYRWLHRPNRHVASPLRAPAPAPVEPSPSPPGVDRGTRAFWAHPGEREVAATRVAALVDAHERRRDVVAGRPRGNPAFSEALFVELMRANQFRRAFTLLSEDCQLSWGSPEAFAAAQGASSMRRLRGVNVKDVSFLEEWTEPTRGTTYRDVAELQVEYTIGDRDPASVIARVVHLIPGGGRWRSICYPM